MRKITRAFKVLSDETRLRVLNLVLERECCVCEVVQALGISQSKASRALAALYDAGFIKFRKEGLWSLYSLDKSRPAYLEKMVEAAKLALATDKSVIADREMLKITFRTGLGCAQGAAACSKEVS